MEFSLFSINDAPLSRRIAPISDVGLPCSHPSFLKLPVNLTASLLNRRLRQTFLDTVLCIE